MPNGDTEWITTTEAAALTGYNIVHLRRLAREGTLVGIKRGRDWFVDKAALLTYKEHMDQLETAKHNPWREELTDAERGRGREPENPAMPAP
ncbi:MAG: helix-turn-helix domain-containing protein [Chloroflexi bacterium]|nr:helix-turn-helix domain-containing protein [Chloroflexota bacterium]MBU1751539.1 helix-turn-helix domain-containing protein [Chloroflexota bacterium]MBU1879856.1 helix-turn-helix domain-containing protein [Chloroflexota bacterium]